jgi:hypothetical protein
MTDYLALRYADFSSRTACGIQMHGPNHRAVCECE